MDIRGIRLFLETNIVNTEHFGHENEHKQLIDLLQQTVKHGESNSALLIGPRGSGKTCLVKSVVQELQLNETFKADALLVNLHGLIHTDDRLALKSITNQLNLDNAIDGKVFGSFAENLAFLLACLRSGNKQKTKSIIFILDEFDLFCNHHNQTLLYNLFDVSQSAQAPICVLGITCRLDVIELLEKRVKSRFSHRQIFVFAGEDEDNVTDLEYSLKRIKFYLKLPENLKINNLMKRHWNQNLENLLDDKKLKNCVQRIIDLDLNERTLKLILFNIVSQLNEKNCKLLIQHFQDQVNMLELDDTVQVLQDLSVLELCLIISMKHHNDIYDNQPMNFEMILTRYIKFANANSNIQSVQRDVIMKAFEHIQNLELVSLVNIGGNRVQKEYQFFKLLVSPQQITEAVKKSSGLPTEVVQWANSSLI